MMAATVANGRTVASAAATQAAGRSAAVMIARLMPTAHMARRRESRGDVIVADLVDSLTVMIRVTPPKMTNDE